MTIKSQLCMQLFFREGDVGTARRCLLAALQDPSGTAGCSPSLTVSSLHFTSPPISSSSDSSSVDIISNHPMLSLALLVTALAAVASASPASPNDVNRLQRRALADLLNSLQNGVTVEDITQVSWPSLLCPCKH
jgi:hypothetical protein